MVARIWRGYTSLKDADAYEAFLKKDFMPSVERKKIPGYKKFQLLRRDEAGEVAFITIMWFEDLEKIKAASLIHSEETFNQLINLKWVFFLLLALISTEWFLRKYLGAY